MAFQKNCGNFYYNLKGRHSYSLQQISYVLDKIKMLGIILKKAEHPRTAIASLSLPVTRELLGGGGEQILCK